MSRIYPKDYLQDLSSFLMAFALRALYLAVSSLRSSQPKKAQVISHALSRRLQRPCCWLHIWSKMRRQHLLEQLPQIPAFSPHKACNKMLGNGIATPLHKSSQIPVLSQPSEILHGRLTSAKLPNPRFQYIIIHNIHIHTYIYICVYIYMYVSILNILYNIDIVMLWIDCSQVTSVVDRQDPAEQPVRVTTWFIS
jgi:hypothetical protein